MPSRGEELEKIYESAKSKRIVLNRDEFAKILGYTRSHLYKLIKSGDISDDTMNKGRSILKMIPANGGGFSVSEGQARYEKEYTVSKDLDQIVEIAASNEAALRVIKVWIKELRAKVNRESLTEVSLEFDRLSSGELRQILDELRK